MTDEGDLAEAVASLTLEGAAYALLGGRAVQRGDEATFAALERHAEARALGFDPCAGLLPDFDLLKAARRRLDAAEAAAWAIVSAEAAAAGWRDGLDRLTGLLARRIAT